MSEKYWEQFIISFLIVAVAMAIIWKVNGALRRRCHARRTYDVYMLGDSIVNSIIVNLDVKFSEAERRHILSEYSKVLATYVPAFNPNSALDVRPIP
jgi:hypothetical protein